MIHAVAVPTLISTVLLGPTAMAAPAAMSPQILLLAPSHGGDHQGGDGQGGGGSHGHGGDHAKQHGDGHPDAHRDAKGHGPHGGDPGHHGTHPGHGGPGAHGDHHGDHGSHGRPPAPTSRPVPAAPTSARVVTGRVRDLVLVRPASRSLGTAVLATAAGPRTEPVPAARSTRDDTVVKPTRVSGLSGAREAIGAVAQPLAPVWQEPPTTLLPYLLGMLGVLVVGLGLWSMHLRGLRWRRRRV